MLELGIWRDFTWELLDYIVFQKDMGISVKDIFGGFGRADVWGKMGM